MSKRQFRIWRGDADGGDFQQYQVDVHEGEVVLDAIHRLQATQTPDLACRWNCKAGKCGSCSVEINGKPRLSCMTRMSTFDEGETVTVTPLRTFPVIRDLVTDVSYNYQKARELPAFSPPADLAPGEYRMQQVDVERSQEFRKCIECFLCQNVCHVIRDHDENKKAFSGPRMFIRSAELEMHPLDTRRDRPEQSKELQGVGYCNITKCCTEVCPEHIKITDNGIIPMKERVADRRYDPLVWLGRKIFRRDQMDEQPTPAGHAAGRPGGAPGGGAPAAAGVAGAAGSAGEVHYAADPQPGGIDWAQRIPVPQAPQVGPDGKLPLSETLIDRPGPASPFGDDVTFPVSADKLNYEHWRP